MKQRSVDELMKDGDLRLRTKDPKLYLPECVVNVKERIV